MRDERLDARLNKVQENSDMKWLEERTILLATTGSYAYGTNTETSDKDYKGVCIPPMEYYLGLKAFNEYNSAGGKNFKNTKDDIDINIIHINKFLRDAMSGVPNNIEMLFLRPQDFIKKTELGQILIDNRHLFLSKAIKQKFGGYAHSQIEKMKTKRANETGRQDLVELYGYDTKFFMHGCRLLLSGIEILTTCDYTTYRPDRNFLLDCRNGKFAFEEALAIVDVLDEEFKKAYEKSELPTTPNYDKINEMLIDINLNALHIFSK